MTEKQAWSYLADRWGKAKPDKDGEPGSMINGVHDYCLCHSVMTMLAYEMITHSMQMDMSSSISATVDPYNGWPYMAPLTKAGAKRRAAFCRRMAKACK